MTASERCWKSTLVLTQILPSIHTTSYFFNTQTGDYSQPIKRGQAWKFITIICQSLGLRGNFGTHSLRKTWGYHARMNGVDLALIMYKLNHRYWVTINNSRAKLKEASKTASK